MKIPDAIAWFKKNFGPKLRKAIAGTPFSADMVTAIDPKAKRDSNGSVTSPLQSQARVKNFRYRAAPVQWLTGDQFADSAFWIHA